jgi:hypothetical protein
MLNVQSDDSNKIINRTKVERPIKGIEVKNSNIYKWKTNLCNWNRALWGLLKA